jgi:hypothetical protein
MAEYAPRGALTKVILAESPPRSYKFVYDKYSGCPENSLAFRVFVNLGYVKSGEIIDEDAKDELLRRMAKEGVMIVDCCQCAVNHLKDDASERRERDRLVSRCFDTHTGAFVEDLFLEHCPDLWFKFPEKQGAVLYARLKAEYKDKIRRIPY